MKNFFLLAFIFSIFISCHRDYDKNADAETLPAITQSGARTGGAIVNGKVWVASKNDVGTANGMGTYCQQIKDKTYIRVDLRGINDQSRIWIKVEIDDLELNKTYSIAPNNSINDNVITYSTTNDDVYFNVKNDCKLKITRLDLDQRIVSGTFELKLQKYPTDDTVDITEGRFDRRFD